MLVGFRRRIPLTLIGPWFALSAPEFSPSSVRNRLCCVACNSAAHPFTAARNFFYKLASRTTVIADGEMPPAGRNVWGMRWVRQRVTDPLVLIIRRGAEPKTLAFSGALGITLGIFPIYGVTALLCGCAVALLGARCNAPTMLLANLLATPLELSLVIPFLRLGEWVVGGKHLLLSKNALWQALTGRASWEVLLGLWHALVGWSVAAPVIVAGLYFALLPVVKFSIQRYGVVAVPVSSLTPLMKDAIDLSDEDDPPLLWTEGVASRLE